MYAEHSKTTDTQITMYVGVISVTLNSNVVNAHIVTDTSVEMNAAYVLNLLLNRRSMMYVVATDSKTTHANNNSQVEFDVVSSSINCNVADGTLTLFGACKVPLTASAYITVK